MKLNFCKPGVPETRKRVPTPIEGGATLSEGRVASAGCAVAVEQDRGCVELSVTMIRAAATASTGHHAAVRQEESERMVIARDGSVGDGAPLAIGGVPDFRGQDRSGVVEL